MASLKKDRMFEHAQDAWPSILMAYKSFERKRPIILYDVQEQRVYAYPYRDFKAELNERSRKLLSDQYEAAAGDHIVVFVRDNRRRKLVSYSMPYERDSD